MKTQNVCATNQLISLYIKYMQIGRTFEIISDKKNRKWIFRRWTAWNFNFIILIVVKTFRISLDAFHIILLNCVSFKRSEWIISVDFDNINYKCIANISNHNAVVTLSIYDVDLPCCLTLRACILNIWIGRRCQRSRWICCKCCHVASTIFYFSFCAFWCCADLK